MEEPNINQRKFTARELIYKLKNKILQVARMQQKEIFLEEFPREIKVFLDDDFRKIMFAKFKTQQRTLAKEFSVGRQLVGFWITGKRPIKLRILQKIMKKNGQKLRAADKQITGYTCQSKKRITAPNIPIKESPELLEFIAHILCDGTAEMGKHTPRYINTCQELLNNFEVLLTQFGEVPITRGPHYISFPKVITEIIRFNYKIKFGTFDGRMPKFANISRKHAARALAALIDDEGNINDNGVSVSLANKPLLQDFVTIVKQEIPEIKSHIVEYPARKKGTVFSFRITPAGMLRLKNLPLQHPAKKEELQYQISRLKNKNWLNYVNHSRSSKIGVLKILSVQSPLSTKEIAKKLGLTAGIIFKKLRSLETKGKIKSTKDGHTYIWGITNLTQQGGK